MNKNKFTTLIFLVLVVFCKPLLAQNDSVFSYSEFMSQVMIHHPIVFQSDFIVQQGNQIVRQARGGFDPELEGGVNQKYYPNSNYYNQLSTNLTIPTWYGLQGHVGYEQNTGVQLNPELFTPNAGLVNVGASVNLGKGLFINKRMADLKQAKILRNNSQLEQKILLNEFELEVTKVYWSWVKSYSKLVVYKQAYKNGLQIYNGVVSSFKQGDKPAIDTVEAGISLQNLIIKYNETKLDYTNQTNFLETYLWSEGTVPLEIDSNVQPPLFFNVTDTVKLSKINSIDSIISKHPLLEAYKNKQAIYTIDLRLKKESLKPELELKYNLINEPINGQPINTFSINDYKLGAKLSYPILNRKARADVQLSKIKLDNLQLDYVNKKREIEFKIYATQNTLNNTQQQVVLGGKNVENYKKMYLAEKTLLEIGESSVFLVNYRINSYIKSQVEQIDFLYDNELAKQKLIYETFVNYQL